VGRVRLGAPSAAGAEYAGVIDRLIAVEADAKALGNKFGDTVLTRRQ
jgi:hypothetical protein